jgi:hypothetical protein
MIEKIIQDHPLLKVIIGGQIADKNALGCIIE